MIPVFDDWQSVPPEWAGGVIALGNFDGVHRGHQALLAVAAEQARALEAPLVALTFEPHPRHFFVPDTGPFRLTLLPAKVRLLEQHGVQAVLAQRFDQLRQCRLRLAPEMDQADAWTRRGHCHSPIIDRAPGS